jgi:hypothetical protein
MGPKNMDQVCLNKRPQKLPRPPLTPSELGAKNE